MPNSTPSGARSATPSATPSPTITVATRNERRADYWTAVSNAILLDNSLSDAAVRLYALLLGYAMQHEAFETDQAAIAGDLGYSDRSVRSWMKELLDAGLLTIQRRGLNQPNVYLIEDAYALYDQTKPQPKNPTNPKMGPEESFRSGAAEFFRSGPERSFRSRPERFFRSLP